MFSKALVTGATSGIGEATARLLASKGISLILSGRNKEKLAALAKELRAVAVVADLGESREPLISVIEEYIPDLVINNAGYGLYGEALSQARDNQLDILEVDAAAVLELSLAAAEALRNHGKEGVIMNVSSVAAFHPFPRFAVYAAAKAFVNHFSQSFDLEMRPYGIKVLAACPGMVSTRFRGRASLGKDRGENRSSMVMSADFAAKEIWWQICKGKPLHVFDYKYRLGVFIASYLLPKRWVAKFLAKALPSNEH